MDSHNPTLGIMDVVQAVNEKAREEVDAPERKVDDSDRALAAQFDTMLKEPIARVEELEAT